MPLQPLCILMCGLVWHCFCLFLLVLFALYLCFVLCVVPAADELTCCGGLVRCCQARPPVESIEDGVASAFLTRSRPLLEAAAPFVFCLFVVVWYGVLFVFREALPLHLRLMVVGLMIGSAG